ncbi:family 43 glycosylhydrolase [Arcticibacter eurypsychrophilus]|uniref:family 43 glycosylhydrolase n=1 Tax=Arcticibacter eurypsychrophilus TaxID=1434752 RepID=UPI00084DE5F9|nr:family 43 glycosylhydrolase [Arcticibacter eurypsychrophilus]
MKQILILLLCISSLVLKGQGLPVNPGLQKEISVHDPVMIEAKGIYYIFCTGHGIAVWSSTDRVNWKREKPVFDEAPSWAVSAIPSFKNHIWAPDISYWKGNYYLYYSVSAFGKNTSCIGLATNRSLDPQSPDFKWVDHGKIIQSYPGITNWNAIDPNLITDDQGNPYLAFGSFWDGLKMARLSKDRLKIIGDTIELPTIASRKKDLSDKTNPPSVDNNPPDAGGNTIEAPFVFKKGNYFYLFASIDYCCKGPKSTYKMILGRSKSVTGPFIDKEGLEMRRGGGSLLLEGNENWYGVGHNAVCTFKGKDYLIYHGYDAHDDGKSKLQIKELKWDALGWPEVI